MVSARKPKPSPAESCATLPEAALRELVAGGLVTYFVARGREGGFTLEAQMGTEPDKTVILGNSRSGARLFASLSTVALLLRRLGINRFTVEASQFRPGRLRAARPERSAAMKAGKLPKKEGSK